eukprot:3691172-Lingulodinium_polyedra.AAC.1
MGCQGRQEAFWPRPLRELVLGKKGFGGPAATGAFLTVAIGATWPRGRLAAEGKVEDATCLA